MTAKIIDGKAIAAEIRQNVKQRVEHRLSLGERPPGLAVVLVGLDAASQVYVKNKRKSCAEVGFSPNHLTCPPTPPKKNYLASSTS